MNVFLRRAALGDYAGTDKWNEVREELIAEAGNLDAMIGVAAREPELPENLSPAVNGLRELHSLTGLASCASLQAVANRFHQAGDLLGEANCNKSLGNIALARSDYEGARQRYEAALPLYQKAGHVLGEAVCIACLGQVAHARSDHIGARNNYEAALHLFQKVGDVLGEANCVTGLGDIALERSDHDGARKRYEDALPLYRQVGDVLGEANCIQSLGDIDEAKGEFAATRELWREALALYSRIPEPYSIGFAHRRLSCRAATPDEAAGHREAARKAWESIGRQDLIDQYLGGSV